MTIHESHYQHWEGYNLGIWRRRAVIASQGLRSALQNKWMRHLITGCWGACLIQVAALFFIGQLLVSDSIAARWVNSMGGPMQMLLRGLVVWIEQHPEISVHTTQNLLFYFFSTKLLFFNFIAISIIIPSLITRDLSSRAIIIYASKAINRMDYFIGKFATVFGMLVLTYIGPVLAAWFMGNLLSPKWHFFWHSRLAFAHVFCFVMLAAVVLSLLALGISAMSKKEKTTTGIWIGLWMFGNLLVPISRDTKPWLKFASFNFDLEQLSAGIFNLKADLEVARQNLPVFGDMLRGVNRQTMSALQTPELYSALTGLAIMCALACVLLAWRVKPE